MALVIMRLSATRRRDRLIAKARDSLPFENSHSHSGTTFCSFLHCLTEPKDYRYATLPYEYDHEYDNGGGGGMDRESVYALSIGLSRGTQADEPDSRTNIEQRLVDFILEFQIDNAFIYRCVECVSISLPRSDPV